MENPINVINPLLEDDFQRIRDELKIPRVFPEAVLREAEAVAVRNPLANSAAGFDDLLMIPFITIDPPGSRDLDQAFFAARSESGYLVRYAIADVGFFVQRGGAIEKEAWNRGLTLYSPDIKTTLYPPALSEGYASLLPGKVRPAVVFSFTLDATGGVIGLKITRSLVRSRAQLTYQQVSLHLSSEREQNGSGSFNRQEWSGSLLLLEEIGRHRQRIEAERGGVNLHIPSQQVERWSTALTGYRLAFEMASDVEEWNAQISLMTGIGAAQVMIKHGAGLLRTLPPPRPDRIQALRLTAHALGVSWPGEMDYDDFVRSLDPLNPAHAVMLHQAARVTGGARYQVFDGEPSSHDMHSGLATFYAHTTAPLRRLADRYVLDLLCSLSSDVEPDAESIQVLSELPRVMMEADSLSRKLESALVDYVEARLMQDRIGELFSAVIIALRENGIVVQIAEPPIRTLLPITSNAESEMPHLSEDGSTLIAGNQQYLLGQSLKLRLDSIDLLARQLNFTQVQ